MGKAVQLPLYRLAREIFLLLPDEVDATASAAVSSRFGDALARATRHRS